MKNTVFVYVEKNDNLDVNDFLKSDDRHKYDKIIFVDRVEIDRLYPLPNSTDDTILKISQTEFKDCEICYFTADLNIINQYKKFLSVTQNYKIITDIQFYICPFFLIHDEVVEIQNYKISFFDNKVYNNNKEIFSCQKKYYFCSTVSNSRIFRHYYLDKIYQNQKIAWSNFPFIYPKSIKNFYNKTYNTKKYNFNDVMEWTDDNQLFFMDYEFVDPTRNYHSELIYENGFSSSRIKKLTEFPEYVNSVNLYNKTNIFDENEKSLLDNVEFIDRIFHKLLPLEFLQSYFIIVPESYCSYGIFYTEKTWKAILTKKPFLILGSQYQNLVLKRLGFKIYDELFDYSFDKLSTINERIDNVSYQINKITEMPENKFIELIDNLQEKIEFNYYHLKKMMSKYNPWYSDIFEGQGLIKANESQIKYLNNLYIFNDLIKDTIERF